MIQKGYKSETCTNNLSLTVIYSKTILLNLKTELPLPQNYLTTTIAKPTSAHKVQVIAQTCAILDILSLSEQKKLSQIKY